VTEDTRTSSPALHAIVAAEEAALTPLCGLTLLERNLRALARAGMTRATVVSSSGDVLQQAVRPHWSRRALRVEAAWRVLARGNEPGPLSVSELRSLAAHGDLYVPGELVCDTRLFAALRQAPPGTVLVDSAPPAELAPLVEPASSIAGGWLVGPARVDAASLDRFAGGRTVDRALGREHVERGAARLDVAAVPGYVRSMRRTVRPLWFPAPSPSLKPLAERRLLDTAQKGALDLPAIVHAPIETFLVARLCRTGVTPNQLTLFAAATAWIATALFASGQLGAGLLVALAVGVLDGLDGKLARVKLETSQVGELEHVSDFLFELSWWSALAVHLSRTGALPQAPLALLWLYLAEGVDGVAKLVAPRVTGRSIDDSSPALRLVRLFGGRRNVYVWILAAGYAFAGHVAPAYRVLPAWQALTAALHWAWLLPRLLVRPWRPAAFAARP
jgi:phosphatidylglycerophosphate synthase